MFVPSILHHQDNQLLECHSTVIVVNTCDKKIIIYMKLILGAAHRNWGADIVEQKEQQTEADVLMLHRPPAWKGYLTNVLILEAARAETEVLMTYRPPARTAYLTNVLVHMATKRG